MWECRLSSSSRHCREAGEGALRPRGPDESFSRVCLFCSASLPGVTRSRPPSCRGASRGPSPTPLPSASATVSPAEGRGGASWPLFFLQKRCSAEPGTTGFPAGTPGLVLPALILGTVPGASLAECPSVPPSKVSEASALAAVCAGGPRRAAGPESGSVGPASARCQMGLPGKTGGMGDQLRATAGRCGVPMGGRAGGAVSGPRRACPEEGRYFSLYPRKDRRA